MLPPEGYTFPVNLLVSKSRLIRSLSVARYRTICLSILTNGSHVSATINGPTGTLLDLPGPSTL